MACGAEKPTEQPVIAERADNLTNTRPNIIIIMADDLGYSDIGCYGGEIQTPNIDKLGAEGMRFTQFYNAGRCCPTRASLLTGLYSHQTGIGLMLQDFDYPTYRGFLNKKCITLAELMKDAGYSTYMSGKWHVGEDPGRWPRDRGFDEYFGLISGVSSYFECSPTRTMALNDSVYTPSDDFYMTSAIGTKASEYIHEHCESSKDPFFMMVTFTAPHWPLHALPEDIAKYEHTYDVGWDSISAQRFRAMTNNGVYGNTLAKAPRPAAVPAWETVQNKEEWAKRMAVYAAMVDHMDQQIGHIMNQLKLHGQDQNTLIIFLSDNGGSNESDVALHLDDSTASIGSAASHTAYKEPWAYVSNTPFSLYKEWMHEGGVSSPLIAWWPEHIEAGAVNQTQGHVIDIMPTLADIAGVSYPTTYADSAITPVEGESLVLALSSDEYHRAKPIFWEHKGNKAVRKGDWKLVSRYPNEWTLHNMATDRAELVDMKSEHPEIHQELLSLWEAWAQAKGVLPRATILDKKREKMNPS